MAYKPHSQRRNAPRARRVASSVPGSCALQAPTEYVVRSVGCNDELADELTRLHSAGWCIHTILPFDCWGNSIVIAWRFVPSEPH